MQTATGDAIFFSRVRGSQIRLKRSCFDSTASDNGDIEPAAYTTVYSPFSNSLVVDATKLADSEFEIEGGLLELYYEPADAAFPLMDATKLAEKVVRDVAY